MEKHMDWTGVRRFGFYFKFWGEARYKSLNFSGSWFPHRSTESWPGSYLRLLLVLQS